MSVLKFLLVTIFAFQLSTCVFAQDDLELETDEAWNTFLSYLDSVQAVVTTEAPKIWELNLNNISSTLNYYIQNDAKEFRLLLNNITVIANTVDGGSDCIELLLHSSGLVTDIFSSEQLIIDNLLNLAQVDISNSRDQFSEISEELLTNCVSLNRNCEGTRRAAIAELERLLPKVKRIPVELLTEIHILTYQLAIDLENAHAELMQIYNKATQNATLCVASKVKNHKQELVTVEIPPDASLLDLYNELVTATESETTASISNLFLKEGTAVTQTTNDYVDGIKGISTVMSRANETIFSLISTTQDFNITLNCTVLDLLPIYNSSVTRLINEFIYLVDGISTRVITAVEDIGVIAKELYSISLESQGCTGTSECGYLVEKIILKQSEIPWQMQQVTNSTIVLLQQTVTAVRESGARVIRDVEEQLEVGLIDLKSCIQTSL